MPITNIKEQFIKIVKHSQRIDEPKVDKLFDKWLDAKRDIIEAWGGNYIIEVPDTTVFLEPLLIIVAAQLLAYEVANLRKCDIDKPRNLAKSVTVE